jgi:hypothetical protein
MTTIEMKEKQAEYAANIAKVYTESAFDIGFKQGIRVAVNDTISWLKEAAQNYGINQEQLKAIINAYKDYFKPEEL